MEAPPAAKSLTDFALYAPAVPGILIAIIVLYWGHWLTKRRDRRKEVRDLCSDLRERAEEAVEAAGRGWTERDDTKRKKAVLETIRRFQTAGVTATDLWLLTLRRKFWKSFRRSLADWKADWAKGWVMARDAVDVGPPLATLKRTATLDPFDDPSRNASSAKLADIDAALTALIAAITREYHRLYR